MAQPETYRGLVCRAVEESGRLYIGQPGFGPHLVSLFVTGPNPFSASMTTAEHVAWVNDPLHSYVADGTGGLVIWAHPGSRDAKALLDLPGLAGFEVHYTGDGTSRDALWDEVLRGCYDAGRPFLWGYAADDTHSRTNINLSWYAARLETRDERSLKAALRRGGFYVSNGPEISSVAVQGRTVSLELAQESEVVWLRAGQYQSAKPAAEFVTDKAPGENHCLQWDRAVKTSALDTAALGLPPGELKFIRAIVRTAPDKLALTQPFRLQADATLENPYAASGEWVRGQTHNHTDTGPGGASQLPAFRLAYQAKGQLGAFSADYSYWESPHQWLESDGTPQVLGVTPDRCPAGQAVEVTVTGLNFRPGLTAQLGGQTLEVLANEPRQLRLRVPDGLASGVYDLAVTNTDGLRGCLPQGFSVQTPEARTAGWQSFTVNDGLAYPHCTTAACFGDQVWIGSVYGVSRLQGGKWTAFRKEVPGAGAYGMVADPAGGVWIGGSSGLAFCNPQGQWLSCKVGQDERATAGRAMERWGQVAFDRAGYLWACNRWAAGLARRTPDGQWERLTKAQGLPADSNNAVACDSRGVLWVGFGNGLHRQVGDRWERVTLPAPLSECYYTSALKGGAAGDMWAAVTSESKPELGGVVHFTPEGVEVYTTANAPLPHHRVRALLSTRDGATWFATDRGVARRAAQGQWQVFTTTNSGLVCNTVLGLAEDPEGRVWFATAEGVSSYAPPG